MIANNAMIVRQDWQVPMAVGQFEPLYLSSRSSSSSPNWSNCDAESSSAWLVQLGDPSKLPLTRLVYPFLDGWLLDPARHIIQLEVSTPKMSARSILIQYNRRGVSRCWNPSCTLEISHAESTQWEWKIDGLFQSHCDDNCSHPCWWYSKPRSHYHVQSFVSAMFHWVGWWERET